MLKSLYTTATGMRAQQTMVDMIANNIANVNTTGFKKSQASFEDLLYVTPQSPGLARGTGADAVPIGTQIGSGTRLNGTTKIYSSGTLEGTDRSLDVAIDGDGFFAVLMPDGSTAYTRNGNFQLAADGTVTTADGYPVQTTNGPLKLARGATGPISVADDGTVSVGAQTAGKFRVVDFGDYSELRREELGRFRAPTGTQPTDADGVAVRSGMLEASNVSVVDRMVALTDVARSFEALQRGLNILSTELDGRAITELGRR